MTRQKKANKQIKNSAKTFQTPGMNHTIDRQIQCNGQGKVHLDCSFEEIQVGQHFDLESRETRILVCL